MPPKYFGPCSIHDCNNDTTKFCKLTPIAYEKAKKKGTFEQFQYLKVEPTQADESSSEDKMELKSEAEVHNNFVNALKAVFHW
ncbi:6521_t:CDS:2 [Cetraspora pellucida]|uniref:6521_t:CDS:1 n=1 Tax=Cetraspora pellucida TaxID=1433469 RepID=A0A9N9GER0_9GLOM|nr:6521_t:CDS:2 [Cetraspora pellucida]